MPSSKRKGPPPYFKFHIGDYMRDAAELSLTQHGAYLGLMLWYYSTGRPIPNDLERIYRRIHAHSNEEKHSARFVLEEFFVLDGPVWRHKRIDHELDGFECAQESAKKAAQVRWSRNKAENSSKNKESGDAIASKSQCDLNATQDPRPKTQDPIPKNTNPLSDSQANRDRVKATDEQAKAILSFLNDKRLAVIGGQTRGFKPTKVNITPIRARLNDGYTLSDCKKVIANRCMAWKDREDMHQYLTPQTLFRPANFAKYIANLPVITNPEATHG